ncbi:MAG TPA: hypothetical protein VLL48_00435 [Longimicrobiales bacterium]|nr:hypothetical protein [Longimicrobiales bacterium]
METLNWSRWIGVLALVPAMILAACDAEPTDPLAGTDPEAGASEVEAMAASTVEESWSALVTGEELYLETLDAVEEGAAPADALDPMLDAGAYAAEVEDGSDSDEEPLADEMEGLMEESYLDAAIAVRGDALPDEVIAGVESTLAELDLALGGRDLPPEVADRMREARDALDDARTAAARGQRARALRHATRGAAALRDLHPRRRATALVRIANRLLERAIELAGPEPDGEVAAALRLAEEACGRAEEALEAEAWRVAVRSALRCGRISLRVIAFLAGGVSDDVLADRVEAIVERAAGFYERAVEIAGPDPGPRIEEALALAEGLLTRAREALAAEEWRRAVHLARRSAAISRRVIAAVRRGWDGDRVTDRITDAVQTANDMLDRVTDLVGDDPDPEVEEMLDRATGLVDEANQALGAERWRIAFHKALHAMGVLWRIVVMIA